MSHIKGQFDVQVDSNHRWDEDRMLEVDVYPVSINGDGQLETDTTETLVHVEVPALDYCTDMWYDVPAKWDEIRELPEHAKKAVEDAVAQALSKHLEVKRTQKYSKGDTVFIKEYMFPGEVEAHTTDGGYIIHMANSGELDEFAEDELEDYDAARWEGE